jgi:hypothetical protein
MDRGERVMLVVEQITFGNPTAGHRFPPEDTPHLAPGGLPHHAGQRSQEVSLPLRRLGKRHLLAFEVLSCSPVLRCFYDHYAFVIRVPNERQITLQIVKTALPPRIVRLPDHVVGHAVLR